MNQATNHNSELPPPIQNIALPLFLIIELSRKHVALSGVDNRLFRDTVRIDADYCLDAPDELPAGGCASETMDLDDGDPPFGFAVQLTVQRVQQQEKKA